MMEQKRLVDQLDALESESLSLDPDASMRSHVAEMVEAYVEQYLCAIPSGPAFAMEQPSARLGGFKEQGIGLPATLDLLKTDVDRPGIATTSPRFFGYIPGGGLYYSAMADFLAAITNKYAGVFFASPGAVRVEEECLEFLARIVGYTPGYGGYLASGGSLANFTAVVAARDHHRVEGANITRSVIYLTDHAHHCLDKAIHLAGLSGCVVRRIPVDGMYRMRVDLLEKQLQSDRDDKLNPFLVVATAGTTNTGSIDPLEAVGKLAATFGAWYHIDGAYGALFALCDEGKNVLKGMDLSDSIVLDPHKTLFLPYGIGALLVKDQARLLASHAVGADYMQDVIHVEATSPATVSPELTKHFRGLRMWLPLQIVGVEPFRAALEEKMLLARYFHAELSQMEGFEVGPAPDLSVVTYRYLPPSGDPDAFNERLIQAIHKDGRIFVSSTRLAGVFMLRMAIVCFRSHRADVETALVVLKELTQALLIERPPDSHSLLQKP
ncbi:MAG: aminotransferase class V-fold PLP-dependent enzyme [Bacteroidetes bacterium]|nr:aminotransferase class V-fold PLP-dependent enzyme [Bacteroidota bacterium]